MLHWLTGDAFMTRSSMQWQVARILKDVMDCQRQQSAGG
jgi:hypothetical protein